MASRRAPGLGIWLALLAFGGLLAGHFLGYVAAAPDSHARADLLAATGHGSHGLLVSLGTAAALAALIGLVFRQLRGRANSERSLGSLMGQGLILWVLQSVGFTVLEILERGGPSHAAHLLHEPAFLLGFAAQLVVAALAVALVWLLSLTVDALLRLLTRPASEAAPLPTRIVSAPEPRVAIARRAWNLRGPPQAQLLAG